MSGRSFERPRIFADGIVSYPKKGWEPPPPIEGYRRKSENARSADAWTFVPEWPACVHRTIEYVEKPCGAINVVARCKMYPDPVFFPFCQSCGRREVG